MRMRWDRSGRRKLGWTAGAVAIALVGHAILMTGGGHPTEAAHAVPASMVAAPHRSTAHRAATAPDAARSPHAGHDAPRASHAIHGVAGSPAAVDPATAVEPVPTGGDPTGDETAGCGGMLVLARPKAAQSSGSGAPPSLAGPVAVAPPASRDVGAVAADTPRPTAPPRTRRALLQIYRI